jgi:regulator of sigma E protease
MFEFLTDMFQRVLEWIPVILGIGFLIFVHELGHFIVAKLVGIRVLAFSIGFGPRVFGFRIGETDYRLSAFPLGGYVRMAGESPEDEAPVDDRDFRAKSVSQRAAVISAGVVMNGIFGFLIFALAFSLGVRFDVPEVGAVREGGPAWKSELPEGARILRVNGNKVYDFMDVSTETALSRRSTFRRVASTVSCGTRSRPASSSACGRLRR